VADVDPVVEPSRVSCSAPTSTMRPAAPTRTRSVTTTTTSRAAGTTCGSRFKPARWRRRTRGSRTDGLLLCDAIESRGDRCFFPKKAATTTQEVVERHRPQEDHHQVMAGDDEERRLLPDADCRLSLGGHAVHREEHPARERRLALDLPPEDEQILLLRRFLLPLRFEKVNGGVQLERPVDLLPDDLEGLSRSAFKEREEPVQQLLQGEA